MHDTDYYDIIVVGSGIAGATTALALSQAGIKTLVLEASRHPRFAIGESTVPVTTALFESIGKIWNIPEIKNLTRYTLFKKNTPFLADYPKSHFWFGLHQEGESLNLSHELLLETFDPPLGPDVHLIREKFDAYLVSLFPKYKIDYVEHALVENFERDDNKMGSLHVKLRDSKEHRKISCRFVVDATGHSALFSKKLGYFGENLENLHTNTRGIYGHFELDSIQDLDSILGGPCFIYRLKRSAGTMHHCFHGGWIWVIPFSDGTVSVGIILDRTMYPLDPNITPEEEFFSIINRFPSVKAHLGKIKFIRPLINKSRLQIMSKSILGDGIIITPHAAAFIDALYSTGMALTASFVRNFVPIAQRAFKTQQFGMEQFLPIEHVFFREIKHIDYIVSGTIESFRHIELFKQYWKLWVRAGTLDYIYTSFVRGNEIDLRNTGLYGACVDEFREDTEKMWSILMEGKTKDPIETAKALKKIVDKYGLTRMGIYQPFSGELGSPFPYNIYFKGLSPYASSSLVNKILKQDKSIPFYRRIKIIFTLGFSRIIRKILFRFKIKNKQRWSSVKGQRLPWYKSRFLK